MPGSVGKCYMIHTHMAGGNSSVCNFSLDSAVRGYHIICKYGWNTAVGDVLICKRESGNDNDWFAVGIRAISESMIVGTSLGTFQEYVGSYKGSEVPCVLSCIWSSLS